MKKNECIQLIEGSKYEIYSLGTKEEPMKSRGIFKGYTVIGNTDAICLELDSSHKRLKGKIRIIPTHMVLAIDIIKEVKKKMEKREEGDARYYQ